MNRPTEFTPQELARHWRVRPSKIYTWLNSGELRGADMSLSPGITRPRWRISQEEADAFRDRRKAKPQPNSMQRRRRV
ncbi:MAG: helix-turn-helix domain-containing protein [Phycisphaeraceae bacterium]|nr:helix-turn-helix domain-containing protein [Phycisphaeraceae bacterium]